MPGEQLIGRLAVKVLPDTSDFRRRAKRQLEAIEKGLEIKVDATFDSTGLRRNMLTELRKINQENRASDSRKIRFYATVSTRNSRGEIAAALRRFQNDVDTGGQRIQLKTDLLAGNAKVQLDEQSLDDVRQQMEQWRRQNSPIIIAVKANWVQGSGLGVSARLSALTRPRTVSIIPTMNDGAYAKVLTALAALSGARLLSNIFGDVARSLLRLDQALPIIGSLALAIAGLAGWGLSAASNLFALSSALAQIGPAALVLPGIFGGLAIGLGVSVVAFQEFNERVPQAATQLKALGVVIGENFWAKATGPINNFVKVLLPQVVSGVQLTATRLGEYWGALAKSLTRVFDGLLANMFNDLNLSIALASLGTDALAGIIAKLGAVGAGYLPQLAQWFVIITTRLDNFLGKAAADGSLERWINTGLVQLQALGSSLASIGGILAAISQAATNAGGSGLQTFADTLNQIQATVEGPAFQTQLTAVFASAHQAMELLASGSGPAVTDLFRELGQVLQTILPIVGETLGTALSAISDGLTQVEVPAGLVNMFDGIQKAVESLAPAMAPLGSAFGTILTLVGTLAAAFGPLLATAIVPLSGALQALAPVIGQVATVLATGLTAALTALGPLLVQGAQALAGFATSGGGIGNLSEIFSGLLPVITQFGTQLAGIIGPVFAALAPAVGALASALGVVLQAVLPLASALLDFIGAVLVPLAQVIGSVLTAALPKLGAAFAALAGALTPIVQGLTALVNFLMPVLVPVLTFLANLIVNAVIGAINGLAQALTGVVTFFVGFYNIIAGLFTGNWGQLWEGVKQVFSGAWDFIVGLFNVAINIGLLRVAGIAMTGLRALFTAGWAGIKAVFSAALTALKAAFTTFLTALKTSPVAAFNTIKSLFTSFGAALRSITAAAWTAIQTTIRNTLFGIGTVISTYVNLYRTAISGGMNAIKAVFSAAWTVIRVVTSQAWSAIRPIVATGVSNVVAIARGLPGKIRGVFSGAGNILKDAGRRIILGLVSGIEGMVGRVKSTLGKLTSMIPDWKGPAKKDSRLLYDAGRLIVTGLIKGLTDNFSKVKSTLQGLTSQIPRDASKGLTRTVTADRGKLLSLASQWEAVGAKLKAAADKVKALREEAKRYSAEVRQQILSTGDITKGEDTSFNGIINKLKTARDEARRFAELLAKLSVAGLNKDTFDQIVQAGPGVGTALAESILDSGKVGVSKINKLQAELATAAGRIANTATLKMHAAGISMADGLVAGLLKQQKAIEKQMTAIAKSMVAVIKKELGIRSPSRVMKALAMFVGEGFTVGLDVSLKGAQSTFTSFARDLASQAEDISLDGVKAPSLGAALGQAAYSSEGTVIKQLIYNAAPNNSLGSEEDLFAAADRTRFGW